MKSEKEENLVKRLISLLLVLLTVSASSPAYPEEEYDPQHTMLALNMAIVSIHRIVSTQDRIILDQEYNTIINKLALGNIESDYEMTGLFAELMNFITGKGLRQEEAQRFQERYNRREQRQIINALSGIRAYGGNLWSWLGSLATSCVSSYFTYHSAKGELLEGLNDDLWQLKKEEIEDCNYLQVKLLNSSWNLLRQYKLPDEYRLTQETLDGYYKAVNEADPAKRLRMLRARNVEKNFQVYPPYWYYRAKAAQESGDDSETLKCWDKFAEVWRPVLRNDPYKLEEAKYRVQRLSKDSGANREEIRRLLGVIQDNTTAGDWSNNLFAGVVYFLLGDKDDGIACVEVNVDFGYEETVSKTILAEMKKGELDAFTLFALQRDLESAIEKPQAKQAEVKQPEPKKPEPKKQTSGKRRDLTKAEIISIAQKYGANQDADEVYKFSSNYGISKDADVYIGYMCGVFTWSWAAFCSDGIHTSMGAISSKEDFLSYDDLRNDPQIVKYLRKRFGDFDDDFFKILKALRELD